MGPPRIRGGNPSARVYRPLAVRRTVQVANRSVPGRGFPYMRAVQLLRGSPRRKAVAGFAAAITVVTSFFVVQGLAGANVDDRAADQAAGRRSDEPGQRLPGLVQGLQQPQRRALPGRQQPVLQPGRGRRTRRDAAGLASRTTSRTRPSTSWPTRRSRCRTAPPRCWTTTSRPRSPTAARSPVDQIVFGRVRIRITTPSTGHYVITHPYGVDEFDVTDAGYPEHQLRRGRRHRRPGRLHRRARLPDRPVPALGHRPGQGPGRRVVPR